MTSVRVARSVAVALAAAVLVSLGIATGGCVSDLVLSRGEPVIDVTADATGPSSDPADAGPEAGPSSGVVTLYATDPLRSSYDFERAIYGAIIEDGQVKNNGAQLAFGTFMVDAFTVGIQGGERGTIVDLGTDAELAERLGVPETVGGGQGFAALALRDGAFADARANEVLSREPTAVTSASVESGHVYVFRTVRSGADDLVVKMLVVVFDAGRSVDFQWIRFL